MLSAYGERMHLEVRIPSFDFNPGDGHDMTLMVTCINSVDKSCALEITMQMEEACLHERHGKGREIGPPENPQYGLAERREHHRIPVRSSSRRPRGT